KLEEAWNFIKNMPIEPDVIGWGSLLASSFVHKNMDLAKVAAEKLLLIDPDNSLVQDRDEIYLNMAEIWMGIKKLGFVPKTEAVLHDLDEEVKEEILMHHSEKLAIAYALMKTPKNSTLRIMKNLRVLKWEDIEIADPKEGKIRVKNKAIGVNFVNIYHCTGVYKVPEIPYTSEAVGVLTAIGPGVNDLKVGDMVYHSGSGTYTEEQIVLADKAMPLPPIDPLVVASVVGKGLTAHFLVKSWFKVRYIMLNQKKNSKVTPNTVFHGVWCMGEVEM
ncbi:pentatricopeptide repeat-containing protein, partial [Tanacetum coccineum]